MRQLGETFPISSIGWIDFETASPVDIDAGLYRYMAAATSLVLAVAIGDGPAQTFAFPLSWSDLPIEIRTHHKQVMSGEATWAAWNASFDREAWNQLTDFPELAVHDIIDPMAQATAAGLPGQLAYAAHLSGSTRKLEGGHLIKLFSSGKYNAQTKPDEWKQFLEYAAGDIEAMRDVFKNTMQLPIEDWHEYWANERINLRGVAFDRQLATAAARMAAIDKEQSAGELTDLTNGVVTKVTQVSRMTDWLLTVLHPADREYLVAGVEEEIDEETGEIEHTHKHSLTRNRIQQLSVRLDAITNLSPDEQRARALLDIRQYGGSTTPAKFQKMLDTEVDGLLLGQFVFNGAPQTGRFSSRGIQLHNLMRDALPYELDAIDALREGTTAERFRSLGADGAVSRKLSMLIRPTLVPEKPGNAFLWGDWSQIEARVLPWLAGAEERLEIFREVDRDPSKPDLYIRSAAAMSGMAISDITPELRQRGKVAELACQFGGGRGALQRMAAAYNMHLDNELARLITEEWREANGWATAYWADLWEAFDTARQRPGSVQQAGKIRYVFMPGYLGGSMLCVLPSGRVLTYRRVRQEQLETKDKLGNVIDMRWEWTFSRGFGRVKLWHGILVENITQAVAADVLRDTLVRLQDIPLLDNIRAHTHDEVLIEVPTHHVQMMAPRLKEEMEREIEWSAGLPLKAETTHGYAYSKCKEAQGL